MDCSDVRGSDLHTFARLSKSMDREADSSAYPMASDAREGASGHTGIEKQAEGLLAEIMWGIVS